MSDADKVEYCYSYLYRKYRDDLPGLKALADEVFASATDEVAITSTSYEGGSASGTIKFDKAILGLAIERVLAELDPDGTPAKPIGKVYKINFNSVKL